eukprot:258420-Rhodomonas_salina.1
MKSGGGGMTWSPLPPPGGTMWSLRVPPGNANGSARLLRAGGVEADRVSGPPVGPGKGLPSLSLSLSLPETNCCHVIACAEAGGVAMVLEPA